MPTLSTETPEESNFESLHPFTVTGWLRTADGWAFQTGTAHEGKNLQQLSRQWTGRLVSDLGVHVQATEGTASRMDIGQSRCLRRRQYLTQVAGKVSA